MFLIGEMVKQHEIERGLPGQAMRGLGLIARHCRQPEDWYTTTALFPAQGLSLVSDCRSSPDNAPIEMAADVVYPVATVKASGNRRLSRCLSLTDEIDGDLRAQVREQGDPPLAG